ncbi:MAG: amino acid permease [Clostridia bacterium]|nr:amino acid permease [Clostridia bacterium]
MNKSPFENKRPLLTPYLSAIGLWALAFGCAVGQGAFVMPGGVFLPIAGPIGTVIGIVIGGLVMIVLAKNYHYLMNKFPDSGGTYTYTKKCFGYDHGFLSAWFLILTYLAILWANATALPIVARTLLGNTFQFGFHYEVAGFDVWFGEILLSVGAIVIAALICLFRKSAARIQIAMGIILLGGVVLCFAVALSRRDASTPVFTPQFAEGGTPIHGIFTIFALAPWAYAGFESVSHSAAEAKFPLKKVFRILVIALITSAAAYALLALLATLASPVGGNWRDYIAHLDDYSGLQIESKPTFFAAFSALGNWGSVILGVAALCGIFTGLIGNFIALSRLVVNLSEDEMIPGWLGETDKNHVPRRIILIVLGVSVLLPFIGRATISWIVDATTVGATIVYAFASASALKTARLDKSKSGIAFGVAGVVISLFFALAFLIPNLISVQTLATESYFVLAAWGFLGFLVYYTLLRKDKVRRLGRSNVALIVMLGVIIFTSTVWMRQTSDSAIFKLENADTGTFSEALKHVDSSIGIATATEVIMIVLTLILLFFIYNHIQKREKQIEVEKALAEESSRAKTSFLSNMSHEIRTPLNAIIGLDNIALRDPDLTPKTRENLEKIGASAKHLLGLINDILDMSRIESSRMVLKNEEFSFREFIDQVNIIINGQCIDKGLRYECNIIGKINDYYFGDDLKLKQVLINILGNSVKFTESPGEVSLTVEQIASEDGVCSMRFYMKDTGIGMDKEFIPKIFEAFSQEDATTTNRYGGSGLGMAITKNFVEMMGGSINVESEKGVGSTFTVTVKLNESDRTCPLDNGFPIPADLKALVVDDDEVACEHAKIVLAAIGIDSESVLSGEEGLKLMKDASGGGHPFKLLLTDYKMPGMTGRDLTRAVREFDGGETAIIMLTGYNWDIIDEEAHEDGVDCIISKPLFTESLLRAVHSVLERKNGGEASGQSDQKESDSSRSSLSGLRLLIAEDVDANAEILADLLDLEEIESERARDGGEVVEMFSSKPIGYYDAILMDVRMPVKDGLEATREIRALDREDVKSIPIIAMTANVFDEDVERSKEAGMNAHLGKPVEPEKLYATIEELVAKKK